MLYICYGVTKSASTYLYQLTEEVFRVARRPTAKLPPRLRGPLSLENFIPEITDEILAGLEADMIGNDIVVRTHGPLFPGTASRIASGTVFVNTIIRDPREIALSMIDHGRRSRMAGLPEFAECEQAVDAFASIDVQVDRFLAWSASPKALVVTYNEVAFEPEAVVAAIARQLGVFVDPAVVLAPFKSKRGIGQFNLGKALRFRDMEADVQAAFLARYRALYERLTFETPAALAAEARQRGKTLNRRSDGARLAGDVYRWLRRSLLTFSVSPPPPAAPARTSEAVDAAALLEQIEALLVRERLFREDFEHRVSAELRAALDGQMTASRLRMPLAFGDRTKVMIHTLDGQRLVLDMREPFMAYHLIEHGEWERPVRDLIRRLLPPGGTFVDVGANIGVHSLLAATLVGSEGHVLALEPQPETCAILRENVEINGLHRLVRVIPLAASSTADHEVAFEFFPQHPAMSGFKVAADRIEDFHGKPQTLAVRTTTLDALAGSLPGPVDLVKIDVEGFELDVLRGASRLLSADSQTCFLIEHDHHLVRSVLGDEAIAALWGLIESAGLHVFKVDDALSRQPMSRNEFDVVRSDLLLARPASRAYRIVTQTGAG